MLLDRDGTLNEKVHYFYGRRDLKLILGVSQVLRPLKQAGYRLVVMTNQAGVAGGYYKKSDVEALHRYMNRVLGQEEAAASAYYYYPHHPEHDLGKYRTRCRCHKPGTGAFETAERGFEVDKAHSFMVGDGLLDVEVRRNCDIAPALVGIGYGREQHQKDTDQGVSPVCDHYGETLMDTAWWAVGERQV